MRAIALHPARHLPLTPIPRAHRLCRPPPPRPSFWTPNLSPCSQRVERRRRAAQATTSAPPTGGAAAAVPTAPPSAAARRRSSGRRQSCAEGATGPADARPAEPSSCMAGRVPPRRFSARWRAEEAAGVAAGIGGGASSVLGSEADFERRSIDRRSGRWVALPSPPPRRPAATRGAVGARGAYATPLPRCEQLAFMCE